MEATPKEIKSANGVITILWSDGHASRYDPRDLRLACRCAACVDEWSHKSLVQPDRVPMDVKPRTIDVVGNYALHIDWSDGHNTGLYTYTYLKEVCACEECKKKRLFNV
jgi:ATP-binding protein involved in chromosome partitioning